MVHRGMPLHYHFFHIIIRILIKPLFKFQMFGVKNVPPTGGVLFMSNHASHFDSIFLGAAVRRNLHYMARATLFKPGLIKRFLLSVNAFPVHLGVPDRKAIRQALQLLGSGNQLLIFPEGTRTVDGSLGKARPGIGLIAYRVNVPVVPIFLSGTQEVLPRGAKIPKLAKITVSFGKPLDMEQYRKSEASRETYVNIGSEVMTRIAELKEGIGRRTQG